MLWVSAAVSPGNRAPRRPSQPHFHLSSCFCRHLAAKIKPVVCEFAAVKTWLVGEEGGRGGEGGKGSGEVCECI